MIEEFLCRVGTRVDQLEDQEMMIRVACLKLRFREEFPLITEDKG